MVSGESLASLFFVKEDAGEFWNVGASPQMGSLCKVAIRQYLT